MVHADGSILQTWDYLKQNGLQGFVEIWPRPTAIAWKIIVCYGAFEAALQLLLPGKRVEGPISPSGNRPVYKVLDTRFLCENCFVRMIIKIRVYKSLPSTPPFGFIESSRFQTFLTHSLVCHFFLWNY